ncbi:heavy metal translocating P-type ATPase [Treponema sp. UBA6852]|uniref:heavy metal translocating P-type ATPase n=1 Tax=Treponema sp. UBA6852 TaxID=1947744 RepID=UPI000E8E679F|nr:heavy metal translocating P-type ATPase [Treponema sp. UBA6852]HBP09089.1 Cu2+-exporting ATPase [Treponema sp.]
MEKFLISGMSCAACSARIEKAVTKVKGVESCAVSLLTNSMSVEGTASAKSIIQAVEKAGYGAKISGSEKPSKSEEQELLLENSELKNLKTRLVASLIFLLILMYFSMGHMMLNFPLPAWFNGNHVAMGLVQLLLTIIILFINRKFFISGTKGLLHGTPNMDTLVALGSGVSFAYSLVVLFNMTDAVLKGDEQRVMKCMDNFYFEGAAMIVTLITVGKMLESISKGKTTNALKNLIKLKPENATVIREGKEIVIPISEVKKDDIFIVKPGENIPVDGIVIEGESSVNESALTGESIPVDKSAKSEVYSATINLNGFLKCKALRIGEETALSQIIKLVSDASATKAPIAKTADKVSGIFVPSVLLISAITFFTWLICGAEFNFALSRAIAVLVISCPCALGLATPVAIMVGNGVGAKNGILFKTATSLEETGKIKIVALDKTGTITKGEPEVTDIIAADNVSEKDLVKIAASLESKSSHPLAKAVVKFYSNSTFANEEVFETQNFVSLPGNGISCTIKGEKFFAGNLVFIEKNADILSIKEKATLFASEGKTPLVFAKENKILGMICVADKIKDDSAQAVSQLKAMSVTPVMITGDNEKTAQAIAKNAGIEKVIAGVLPDGKAKTIATLKSKGKTAMAGDGINDAPALASADIGIALGAGSDIAIDSAQVVLMKNSLLDVPAAIRLSKATLKNIHENLFWAFFYNIAGIPLAAGIYYKAFGLLLNPMFAAAAMSLSSFCVVTNALRLNFFKPYKFSKSENKFQSLKRQEEVTMSTIEKTIKVEGMMCGHCEAHVKEALEKIKGVEEATADHETGKVVLKLSKDVDDKKISDAVKKAGYTVV